MSKTSFLSYVHSDNKPIVARLHAELTACGIHVFHEIRDAIDAREREAGQ